MVHSLVAAILGQGGPGQIDGFLCDIPLEERTVFGYFFYDMTIMVARDKIHPDINISRVLAKNFFDHTHGLDKFTPIHLRQKSKGTDAVADRCLIGGQALISRLNHPFNGQMRFGKPLFDPAQRQGQRRALSLQSAGKFRDKRTDKRRVGPGHVRNGQDKTFRIFLGNVNHLIRPIIGARPVGNVGNDNGSNTPEIFNQRKTQHDRDGPQFTQFQMGNRLVGLDETDQIFGIHPAVAVGNDFPSDIINPGQSGGWPAFEPGQAPAESTG